MFPFGVTNTALRVGGEPGGPSQLQLELFASLYPGREQAYRGCQHPRFQGELRPAEREDSSHT